MTIRRILMTTTMLTAFAVVPNVAHADPISLAIASTASAVFSAGGAAAFTFLGFSGWGAVVASVAVRAALGYALNSLTPKPNNVSRGYAVNALGPVLAHAVVYGEAKVGGSIFYQNVTGTSNRYFHKCVAVAGHEIDSYVTIYLNDEAVTLDGSGNVTSPSKYVGHVRINTHLGSPTQAADADLVADVTEWTSAHQAKGVAYIYARFDYDATIFSQGIPVVTCLIKGRKVYDPRTGITQWSNNPALCVRDYLTSDFGLFESSDEIDDGLFNVAADICEEDVSGADRYTCNGAFLLDAAPEQIINVLLSSMGGMFWYYKGRWACRAAKYVSPELSFDEDDLRGNLQTATRHSRRDNYNIVRGVYRGAATNYQETDYEEVTDSAFVDEDNGVETATDLPLIFTDNEVTARRIAKISLRRNRQQLTQTAAFGLRAIDVNVGDTVLFSNSRAGFVDKVFECVDWRFSLTDTLDLQVNMILRETNMSVFE